MNTWREVARPIIEEVIKRVGKVDEKLLRSELKKAYPFGQREYHPYKVWLDEIKVQLGKKTFGRITRPDPNQRGLFDDESGI